MPNCLATKKGLLRACPRQAVAVCGVFVGLLGFCDTAVAQVPGRLANEDGGILQWVVFLGLAVVVCATGFLNPKRSHLN